MLRSFLFFPTADVQLLLTHYRQHRVIERSLPFGMVRGELICPVDSPDSLTVVALWPSNAAYERWVESAERANALAGLDERLLENSRSWTESDPTIPFSIDTSLKEYAGYGDREVDSVMTVIATNQLEKTGSKQQEELSS